MEIKKDLSSGKAVIYISGEIDSTNSGDFEIQLKDAVNGEEKATLDLSALEYVSSAGLRVFLMVQKIFGRGDNLIITGANEEVMDIFEVTGFSKLLNLK